MAKEFGLCREMGRPRQGSSRLFAFRSGLAGFRRRWRHRILVVCAAVLGVLLFAVPAAREARCGDPGGSDGWSAGAEGWGAEWESAPGDDGEGLPPGLASDGTVTGEPGLAGTTWTGTTGGGSTEGWSGEPGLPDSTTGGDETFSAGGEVSGGGAANAGPPGSARDLLGEWVRRQEIADPFGGGSLVSSRETLVFLPDGTFVELSKNQESGKDEVIGAGHWRLEGDSLEFRTGGQERGVSVRVSTAGNRLVVATRDMAGFESMVQEYRRTKEPVQSLMARWKMPSSERWQGLLQGIWLRRSQESGAEFRHRFVFAADGRYYESTTFMGTPASSHGKWSIDADGEMLMTAIPHGGSEARPFQMITPDLFALVASDAAGGGTGFFKRIGGREEARRMAEATEARWSRENAEWRRKIPTAPIRPAPFSGAAGVPTDPNPGDIYPGATVFASLQNYFVMNQAWNVTGGPGAGGTVYDRTDWYFLPNGRVYRRVTSNSTAGGNTLGVWFKYRIEGEKLILGVGKKKEETLKLEGGRRFFHWAGTQFDNQLWASAQLANGD